MVVELGISGIVKMCKSDLIVVIGEWRSGFGVL